MIIDFHTHFFPDSIAERTIKSLSEFASESPVGNGTLASLRDNMHKSGVSLSLNLPVATRKEQVTSINNRMIELQGQNSKVLTFGAMHPHFHEIGDVKQELKKLSLHGIRGIKMHPEYQDFYPDDPIMARYYEACRETGMICLLHAGKDPAYPNRNKAHPKRLAQVAKIPNLNLVLAHLGGYQQWEDVLKYIAGLSRVYLDTAFCHELSDILFKDIILSHGPYKILFGSDFPWSDPRKEIEKIKGLDMGVSIENQIFSKNARWLLDI